MSRINRHRSVLFISALAPDGLSNALASGADLVCIDLEDAVPINRKKEARSEMLNAIRTAQPGSDVQLLVRINSLRSLDGIADLQVCLAQPTVLAGLVLPKLETADEARWAAQLADEAHSPLDLFGIIETTRGLENCLAIAGSHQRVKALFFGGYDLSAALGCEMDWEPLLYARSRVVHAAAENRIDAIDSPYLDLADANGLRASAIRAKSLGMVGQAAKHASQVPIINQVFTPLPSEIKRARAIIELFQRAPTAPVVFENKLIELPTIKRLERVAAYATPQPN